jgi:uncharacterized Zn-binding protein involved in type VI secretion
MPGIQRVGDRNVAGGAILQGDSSVRVNGRPIAVENMPVSPHTNFKGLHSNARTVATQNNIRVNGKRVITSRDRDSCGHQRGLGSPDVG